MLFTLGTKGKPGRCDCDANYQSDHLETWLNPVNPKIQSVYSLLACRAGVFQRKLGGTLIPAAILKSQGKD